MRVAKEPEINRTVGEWICFAKVQLCQKRKHRSHHLPRRRRREGEADMTYGTGSLLFTVLLTFTGCKQPPPAPPPAPTQPAVKAAPATPLSEKKDELGTENAWTPAWDAFIEKNLPPE